MRYDPFLARILRGLKAKEKLSFYLNGLQRRGYVIFFITVRFKSSRLLYTANTQNPLKREHAWNDRRNYYDNIIQQWIVRAYRGNTLSEKWAQDEGWEFIGRWEEGKRGFIHVHGFLAVFVGDHSALNKSMSPTKLATRLCERSYHEDISNIDCSEWEGSDSGAVPYIFKETWRSDSGEEFIFARAPDPSIIDQRPHLSDGGIGWRSSRPKSAEQNYSRALPKRKQG